MTAKYYNKATNETYTISGIKSIEQAFDMAAFVCKRNDWNISMFNFDVTVKVN